MAEDRWFQLLNVAVGSGLTLLASALSDHRALKRAKEAREAEQFQRQVASREQTLLPLQESVARAASLTGKVYHENVRWFYEEGVRPDTLVYVENREALFVEFRMLQVLAVRIHDDEVRDLARRFIADYALALGDPAAERTVWHYESGMGYSTALNERIGKLLRSPAGLRHDPLASHVAEGAPAHIAASAAPPG